MSRAPLLIELFTEELPPKALRTLGEVFAQTISHHLSRAGLLGPQTPTQGFASPRRLAVLIDAVSAQGADQARREKLLPVSVGLDAQGAPTAPLLKKLQTLGLQPGPSFSINQLIKESDGKQDVLFVDTVVRGARLAEAAQEALDAAIA
ncbi:MAG: glycine--tRNA ligase subunit beta, partial [Betaproteobacteria bacterium]|nr:glycine--tRNA ligase subunit beta [Betaproteobacteria bacterium]